MNASYKRSQAFSGMTIEEIVKFLEFDKPFRATQVYRWIADGARSFQDMTNLPAKLREELEERATLFSTSVSRELKDPDGTVKLQVSLGDGNAVETVLLTDADGRKTACVSSQVGCPMACAFCQTGQIGYSRNLEAGEIIEQFYHLEDSVGRLDNIVFMGMGEPMLNLGALRRTVAILTDAKGRGLSRRRITVSTAGIVEGIRSLADDGPDIRLAISLTTADPDLRERLMPVTKANPLPLLHEAIKHYCDKTGNRVTLEAALMAGINTSDEEARRIANFSSGLNVHINIIPWNPIPGLPFETPSSRETEAFLRALELRGLNATLRTKRGRSIGGACGQLGASVTSSKTDQSQ